MEHALEIKWAPLWDAGAPLPQVYCNDHTTYLIYVIQEEDADWDGRYVTMIDNTGEAILPLALVEFKGHSFRFGIANDEVFSGLPLYSKGLVAYSAHLIENSSWIEELKKIHKIHPYYNEDRWKNDKHYCLLFHDSLFEIIATDYKIETHRTTFTELSIEVAKRLYSRK